MIEGSSLDPDPAGSPLAATGPGGMETSRGGSFRDCAGNRVDARIANNHIGPATITARTFILTCPTFQKPASTLGRRTCYLNGRKLPSLDPKTQKLGKRNDEKNQVARFRIKHLARAALHIVTCITGWAQLEFMIDVALEALIPPLARHRDCREKKLASRAVAVIFAMLATASLNH